MTITYDIIKPYIEKRLVSEQAHPEDPNVRIFNYTQLCQFSQAWDDVTRQCRGLILNVATGEILARPFPKFFNYGEHFAKGWLIPTSTPVVTEKLDGSLGILYQLNGRPWIATRGAFTSDQALWATDWWRRSIAMLPEPDETNLFEIIYPQNRIVVSYDFSGLVHIATIQTSNGIQIPRYWGPDVRAARVIPATDLEDLAKLDEPNSEGFVAFFPSENMRLKIKFPEYVRLHRLVTGVSEIAIWEHLKDGNGLEDLLEKVPDEFYQWVKGVQDRLQASFNKIEDWAESDYQSAIRAAGISNMVLGAPIPDENRKRFAFEAKLCKYPGIMFARLDGKAVTQLIWRMIRPHGQRAFKADIDS